MPSGGTTERGQGDVLALLLLVAISIAGATAVVALGTNAIDDVSESATSSAAEQSMTQFDSKASLVAHGDSDAQRVRMAGSDTAIRSVDSDAGWMNVTVRNVTTGDVRLVLTNATLGEAVYRTDDTRIAYQGGGVWRRTDGGSTMVSPPEFHYRGTTLTLPLVTVTGDSRLDEEVVLSRTGSSTAVYPNATAGLSNPLERGEIVVTVGSRYYEAWGRFFAQRTGGNATIDHANQTATIVLRTPPQVRPIASAVAATGAASDLSMQGSGSFPAFTDSYNSSNGNYTQTESDNGTVVTAGTVSMSGNSLVEGNIRAGGSVDLSGQATVDGTAEWTTGFSASGGASYGDESQIDGVEAADPIASFTREKIDTIASDNDNGGASISGDRLDFGGGSSVTLTSGRYYLDEIDMSARDLVIDTGGNLVEIAVGDDVTLDDTNITVQGGGIVRFYVADEITVGAGSKVTVPNERSTRLWFYGTDRTDTTIQGNQGGPVRFVGVLYAPSDGTHVTVKHANVYGGLVAGDVNIDTGGAVHFDEALQVRSPVPAGANIPRITYLHVSVVEISVADD